MSRSIFSMPARMADSKCWMEGELLSGSSEAGTGSGVMAKMHMTIKHAAKMADKIRLMSLVLMLCAFKIQLAE